MLVASSMPHPRHMVLTAALISLVGMGLARGQDEPQNPWVIPDAKAKLYREKMAEADGLALRAYDYRTSFLDKRALAESALLAYEDAIKLNPKDPEPHYRAAQVSTDHQTRSPFPPRGQLDRAIAHFDAFEALAPNDPRLLGSPGLPGALFQRSILRTKRMGKRNIELGIADYDKQLMLIDQASPSNREVMGLILSNRAELLMMVGRLEESIEGYEQAIEFEDALTYGYGLAVALDRDGQGFRAREVARVYGLRDSADALQHGTAFYVPQGEVFYYVALRAEALADYRRAQAAYREFLRLVPASPFAARARQNLKALRDKAASQPAEPQLRVFRLP